jgi:hypothetical protein
MIFGDLAISLLEMRRMEELYIGAECAAQRVLHEFRNLFLHHGPNSLWIQYNMDIELVIVFGQSASFDAVCYYVAGFP